MKGTIQAAVLVAGLLFAAAVQPGYSQSRTWFVEGFIVTDEHAVEGGPIFMDGDEAPGHPWFASVTYDPAGKAADGSVAPTNAVIGMSRILGVTTSWESGWLPSPQPIVVVELKLNPDDTPRTLKLKTSDTGIPGFPDEREYVVSFFFPSADLDVSFYYGTRHRNPNPVLVSGIGSFPGLCGNSPLDRTDTDGDALLDCWETDGIDYNNDGTPDLVLEVDSDDNGKIEAKEKADPAHRDIFLEIDWMAGHKPYKSATDDVRTAFSTAPPVGGRETRLHTQIAPETEAIPHETEIYTAEGCLGIPRPPGHKVWRDLAREHFGTAAERADHDQFGLKARRLAFHHVILAHRQSSSTSSGCGEVFGNEFVVSLGAFEKNAHGHGVGSPDQQAATIMHELGHNLNLRHGGGDDYNCKPNYLSVMSYSRQFDRDPIPGRVLDYSRAALLRLDENGLVEVFGIQGPADRKTAWGNNATPRVEGADRQLDWNDDGVESPVQLPMPVDINNFTAYGISNCHGAGTDLQGYDDWSNLEFDFRKTPSFAPGIHIEVDGEMTWDELIARSGDADEDLVKDAEDNCPNHFNPGQLDSNADGVGDACTLMYGDSNLDGAFDMADLNTLVDWIVGRTPFPAQDSIPFTASDVNADVSVNMTDLNIYVDCLLGRIDRFPVHPPDSVFCRSSSGSAVLLDKVASLNTSNGSKNHLTQLLNNVQNQLDWGYNETARSRLIAFIAEVVTLSNRASTIPHHVPMDEAIQLIMQAAQVLFGIPVHGAVSVPSAGATSIAEMLAEIQALTTSPGIKNSLTQALNNLQNQLDSGYNATARIRLAHLIAEVVNFSNRPVTNPHRVPLEEANQLILGAVNILAGIS